MDASQGQHVILVGLHVTNDVLYARYRELMRPILERHGGSFGYDFVVAETLKSEVAAIINRVFTIRFADRQAREQFFSDPAYLRVRAEYFEASVASTTMLAEFDRQVVEPARVEGQPPEAT